MGINRILDIGLSGLFSAGTAMQTSSHNIANVNTEGYTRQGVATGTRLALNTAYGLLGGGADVQGIRRLTDEFLVGRLRDQQSLLSRYDQSDIALQEVEALMGTAAANHLGTIMDEFFAAWSELASPPVTDSLREDVLNKGRLLAGDINSTAAGLDQLAVEMDEQIEASVATLNRLLGGVADLNRQILLAEGPGMSANDLRDQRDQLLSEIAQLAKVDVAERGDGTVDIILSGRTVVVRGEVQELDLSRDQAGHIRISTGNKHHPFELGDGRIAGMIAARDEKILGAREGLDRVTAELIRRLNAIHVEGQTAGGGGLLFFTGEDAASIAVNQELLDNPLMVALSRSGLSGDTDVAREIAGLGLENPVDGEETLPAVFGRLLTDIASDAAATRLQLESQTQVVDSLTMRIDAVRGVSLDEEAADMARFQNAYAASAKVVAAAQTLFNTVLEML